MQGCVALIKILNENGYTNWRFFLLKKKRKKRKSAYLHIEVGTCIYQALDALGVALLCGEMKRCEARLVARIHQ